MFSAPFDRILSCFVKLLMLASVLLAAQSGVGGAERPPRTDRHGDPLPDGAIARLGTVRWRHGDSVSALAYSPDGKTIATTGTGRALVLYDAATGKELRTFASRGQPFDIALSPDGKLIVITHQLRELWDVSTGKLLWERKNAQGVTTASALAADGKFLATGNSRGVLHLCDTANGDEKLRIDCRQEYLNAVAYSPDGKLLASGGSDGTICLWDAATGKEVRRITAGKQWIWSVVFSPDGKQIAAGSEEEDLRLWDAATGRVIRTFGDKKPLSAPPAFSPDGKLIASGCSDGTFRLWDAASGEEKRHWRTGTRRAKRLVFSPNGKTLATAADWDGGIRLWDVATGRQLNPSETHHGPIPLLRSTADKGTLISAGADRTLLRWDLATQTIRRRFAWTTESLKGFALSPDGNTLAVADHNTYEVWLWDIRTDKTVKLPGKHQKWIQTIAFSADGRLLASGGWGDDAIHVWDVREGKEVRQIKGTGLLYYFRVLLSPDGKTLVSGAIGSDRQTSLRIWDVASGEERRLLDNRGAGLSPYAFSPDGKMLAATTYFPETQEMLVLLFDMTTGNELCRHRGHRMVIGAVAFSADGRLVVSGGGNDEDNSIRVWEAATGRLIRRFEGHHGWVWAVTFAADGLTVASSAGDSTILLWDITGRQKDGKLQPAALTPRQMEECWKALADADAAKAYDAVWKLVASPEQALPLLRKHLSPVPHAEEKTVARLIADLDSDDFEVRQKAVEELGKFGDAIASDLQRVLDRKPSLEVRRRIQQLLDQTRDWNTVRLRNHRAIQTLEHMGTRQAKEVLQTLAEGAPAARRTGEAKAALQRLGHSPWPRKNR